MVISWPTQKFPVLLFKFPDPRLRELFGNWLIIRGNLQCYSVHSQLIREISLYFVGYQEIFSRDGFAADCVHRHYVL